MNVDQARYARESRLDVLTPAGRQGWVTRVKDDPTGHRVKVAFRVATGPRASRWYRVTDLTAGPALLAQPDYPQEHDTYRIQYGLDGNDITGEMYASDDADSATVWSGAHSSSMIVHVERKHRRDGEYYYIDSSDGPIEIHWYRMRFASVNGVIEFIGNRWGVEFREAVCRCGTPDDCD